MNHPILTLTPSLNLHLNLHLLKNPLGVAVPRDYKELNGKELNEFELFGIVAT